MLGKFVRNWNYPKHATAVTGIYLGIGLIGNAFLAKKPAEDERSRCPCKNMTTGQKVFNGVLAGLYAFEMSGTYMIIKAIGKKENEF